MVKPKEGALSLDFDGVLNTGSTEPYIEGIGIALESVDIAIPPSELVNNVMGYWGPPPSQILDRLIYDDIERKGSSVPDERVGAIRFTAQETFFNFLTTQFVEKIRPVEGSSETLEELSEKYDLGLNTSANKSVLFDYVMPKLGIDPSVFRSDIVYTADDLDKKQFKPDPYVLQRTMARTGFRADRVVMVGDSASDVLTAHYAGVEPIVTLTGNLSELEARDIGVEFTIDDITKIHEVLPQIIGRGAMKMARFPLELSLID